MKKISAVSRLSLELFPARKEKALSVAVSDDQSYAFVEIEGIYESSSACCSRMMILKINGNFVTKMAVIDQFKQNLGRKFAVECGGFAYGSIYWVCLPEGFSGLGQVFAFNPTTGSFKEIKEKRFDKKEVDPKKICRRGEDFYYIN